MDFILQLFYEYKDFLGYIFWAFILYLIIRKIFKKKIPNHHSHWNMLLDVQFSSLEFFDILKEKIESAEVKGISFSFETKNEVPFSFIRRKYFKVEFQEFSFLISASPFGNHFFISYWGVYNNTVMELLIRLIPFVGERIANSLYQVTYHKHDTASSFLTLLHECVQDAIQVVTKQKGIDMPVINKPLLKDFLNRS